jgi:hypothetical protein
VDIDALLDTHMLAAVERQLAFADVIGEQAYQVDLQEGTVRFAGGLALPVGLIGSAAPGPGTWMWAWANPMGYAEPIIASSLRVRDYGERHEILELIQPEVVLDDHWDATRAAVAAIAAAGISAYLPVAAEGGTQVILSIEGEAPQAEPTIEPTRLPQVLNQVVGGGMVRDWSLALEAYAAHRGGGLTRTGSTFVLEPAGGDHGASITIDELGRVASMEMTRSAAPYDPAAAAPAAPAPDPAPEPPKKRGLFRRR